MANVPYNSNPTVEPTSGGSGATYASVPEANPNAFGAQIGAAEDKLGATSEDLGKMYMQRANEASANDKIVNQWAPTVTKLSQDFYSKQGKDAVAGFQPYIDGLQQARAQMLQNATPAEAEILNQYATRHIAQEYDGAMRHQVQQMDVYENQSSDAFVGLQTANAVNAGSNPDMINTAIQSGTARLQMHGMDRGQSPEAIQQQQNEFIGKTTQAVVSSAITRGDLSFADSFYVAHKDTVPAAQQIEIDKTLHSENMRQYGVNAVNAMKAGQSIPDSVVGTPSQVKAELARSAQANGVNPNEVFAVASMESNFGQNTGSRGTVGQDKESSGKSVAEQSQALTDNWAKSTKVATDALGRQSQPWETYACYQQGAGGGPALLNAAQDDPTARAVDILNPLYKTPKDALLAIVGNGGNATMTAGQFLDALKQSYNAHLARTACMIPQGSIAATPSPDANTTRDFAALPIGSSGSSNDDQQRVLATQLDGTTPLLQPQQPNLADAIVAPSQSKNIAFQTGASPVQTLINYDKVYPTYLQQANAIPDLDKREAVLKSLEQDHAIFQSAAASQKVVLNDSAQKLASDPKFTDMNQVPPDMRSALSDDPMAMSFLERRADYNLKNTGNIVSADKAELGTGFYKHLSDVLTNANSPTAVNDPSQLYGAAGKGGDLTPPGFDKLKSLLDMKATPEGQANLAAMQGVFGSARAQITGTDAATGIHDSKGDKLFNNCMALMLANYDKGISAQKTPAQLLNPDSPDYIGSVVPAFKRTPSQQVNDMLKDSYGSPTIAPAAQPRTLPDIIRDVQLGRMTEEAGRNEATKLNLIRADSGPQVPVAGNE